ncbi:MAG: DUF1926 domain-containing protein [Sulfurospirillum sp.]|nr:DUF1926 domain-containing protein [Sulfurospirillum sp.]
MSQSVSFLFGIHMHQPVDNFSFCIKEAVQKSYLPFFETAAKYPAFKFAVHSSGWLLEQIETNYPDLFALMRKLTQEGSIEWFSAGFYEPVLSCIPSKDRRGQIKKLNTFLHSRFGVQAQGLWLSERVWESAIIPDLATCGIKYSVVDDYHFLSSSFANDKLDGYYLSEEGGDENALFPISKKLRYVLPFASVDKAIETILSYACADDAAAIFFDDAEKFGLWPNTYDWVYNQGWLEQFIARVVSDERILSTHYGTFFQNHRPKGLAYLNNTSYIEMGEWSLAASKAKAFKELKQQVGEKYFEECGISFIKGGIWKNFFIKYAESNYLHKRMLNLSGKQKLFSKQQKEHLYKLQTNDVFWHGVFGGIYLPNLRDNAYRYLLAIEKELDDAKMQVFDIDKDGYDELKIKTNDLSFVFSSRYGGQMMEFGSFETLFNWQNTMRRTQEIYHLFDEKHDQKEEIDSIHDGVKMDEDLRSELRFDISPRYSFIDHFSDETITLVRLSELDFREIGDFADQSFVLDGAKCSFSKKGFLQGNFESFLQKTYHCKGKSLKLDIAFETAMQSTFFYTNELNLHFAHMQDIRINDQLLIDGLSLQACSEIRICDDFTQKMLVLKTQIPCDFNACIIHTIAKSERGFEKTPQHIACTLGFTCSPSFHTQITLEMQDV